MAAEAALEDTWLEDGAGQDFDAASLPVAADPAPGDPATAIVLHPDVRESARAETRDGARVAPGDDPRAPRRRAPQASLAEAIGLAEAIELVVIHAEVVPVPNPRPATLLGAGVVEQVGRLLAERRPTVVVVDRALTPVQQRNLERAWGVKVVDRTQLILEIFGARARTREGRLQVDLAALSFQKSRLVRSWTHLERQRGGAGFMGGPGESQLEIDRRLIDQRIDRLKLQLEEVRRTRQLHRAARERVPYPIVGLVGYTNAGKSTLFNRLSGATVLARDMLFATLDPTMRAIRLSNGEHVILSDTVGFISDLPTHLVAAFRATLEEVTHADVILHVRDVGHPDTGAQRGDVLDVLAGLDIAADDPRLIEVWNKIDTLPDDLRQPAIEHAESLGAVAVSALTGAGMERLVARLADMFDRSRTEHRVTVAAADGAALAFLHRHGVVRQVTQADEALHLTVALSDDDWGRFRARYTPLAAE